MTMIKFTLVSVLLVSLLAGCASQLSDSSHIALAGEFEATKVSEITIYFEPPQQKFTVIGLVESRGTGLTETK